jgi:N-acetylmuramoyl-L-alanine amidase
MSWPTASLSIDGREITLPVTAGIAATPLFALDPVAEALAILETGGPRAEGRSLRLGEALVVLQPASATVTIGREIVTLSEPTRIEGPFLFVPLDFFVKALGQGLGFGVEWHGESRRLVLKRGALAAQKLTLEHVHVGDSTTLVLRAGQSMNYRVARSGSTFEVIFPAQRVEISGATMVDDPLVLRAEALTDRLRVTLAPGAEAEDYTLAEPFRIVLDVRPQARAGAAGQPVPIAPRTRRPGVHIIVLDPGHGGTETGAIGTKGTQEKNLTLALAQTLRQLIEERLAVRVVTTRTDDSTLSLTARSTFANQNQADLFVSLHLNSSRGSTAHGAETYFLSLEASDDRAAAAAAAENEAGPRGAEEDELEFVLWDLAQTRHLARSQQLGRLIQEELNQALNLRDRGVKQAPFRVLMGAAMPAVLIEFGFLSNPDEEAQLNDPDYQNRLADTVVRAIARYKAELDAVLAARPAQSAPTSAAPPTPPTRP